MVLHFVALSRVKKFENLYLKPFSFERLDCLKKNTVYDEKIKENERLNNLAKITKIY